MGQRRQLADSGRHGAREAVVEERPAGVEELISKREKKELERVKSW